MSYGRLAVATTLNTLERVIYAIPQNCIYAEISISILNPQTTDSSLELAISVSDTGIADPEEYIEKGVIIPANGGCLERTGLILSPKEIILVKTSIVGCVVRVSGKLITKI